MNCRSLHDLDYVCTVHYTAYMKLCIGVLEAQFILMGRRAPVRSGGGDLNIRERKKLPLFFYVMFKKIYSH